MNRSSSFLINSINKRQSRIELWFFQKFRMVVYPHVLVGMPCYDLTPVTDFLLNPHSESLETLSSHGLTGGECKEQGHIHGGVADPPLLAIPTSCSRVPDCNPNLG